MSVPHTQKMWVKVKYSVVCTEVRTVEIPVPCDFDPENPESMLEAARVAAKRMQPVVMTSDFKHEFDLEFKSPTIEKAYGVTADGLADHDNQYLFTPCDLYFVEGTDMEEVDCEFLDKYGEDV